MVEDVNGYFLMGSINWKYIVKVWPLFSAKSTAMKHYVKQAKRDFDSNLYTLHIKINDLSLEDSPETITEQVIETAEYLKTETNNVVVSTIIARGEKYREKGKRLSTLLNEVCNEKEITIINHSNINPKRNLNWSKLHCNNYYRSVFVRNIRSFFSDSIWREEWPNSSNIDSSPSLEISDGNVDFSDSVANRFRDIRKLQQNQN